MWGLVCGQREGGDLMSVCAFIYCCTAQAKITSGYTSGQQVTRGEWGEGKLGVHVHYTSIALLEPKLICPTRDNEGRGNWSSRILLE